MLSDTYGHSPIQKMFDNADVYGVAYDEERASRPLIKIGIIGLGGVALSKHIPAIARLRAIWEPVKLAAVCNRNRRTGENAADTNGCRWYGDYKEMLGREELDGVIITGPDSLHYEHAMACLERGIHVLVEKPLSRSLVESEGMCRYAQEKGLILMTVSNKRFSPPYFRAKKNIDNGTIANPAMFVGKFNLGYDYVDILEGGTIHIFDIMRYLMGNVKTVSAVGTRQYDFNKTYYPFDHAISSFEFGSGAIGSIYTSSAALSLKPWERVEVYGEKCWLAVEDQFKLILNDSEEGPSKVFTPVIPNTLLFDEEFGGFMGLIENFIQSIRGAETPAVTGWDGLKALELVCATHLSIKNGGKIRLPLDFAPADKEVREWFAHAKIDQEKIES
ncbi:MAG: Gfo/Idh/MocA family oxidoreductase [Clostridia bacterium]|nr:Gfo/Idh/MocA family oxidoreductase [Clostridia bacterium]